MSADPNQPAATLDDDADDPAALEAALRQNEDVKEKVEECADDLGAANETVKDKLAGSGAAELSAHELMAASDTVKDKVEECADDIESVNQALAEGIEELRQTRAALVDAKAQLARAREQLSATQAEERKAQFRALHDPKTGLPNRILFDDRLARAIATAKRNDWTLAVMFLDLDRFKQINDVHGHAAGDQVLRTVAERLLEHARDSDTVCCRNGGDEFLYLLVNPKGDDNIRRIAGLVETNIARPIHVGELRLFTKPSIGIAVYPRDGIGGEQLISNADAAMYRAKKLDRGCVFFDAAQFPGGAAPAPAGDARATEFRSTTP